MTTIEFLALGAVLALPLAGLVGYIWLGQREARKQAEFDAWLERRHDY